MNSDAFCDCHGRLLMRHCALLREHYGLPADIIAERGYESVLGGAILESLGFTKTHRRIPGMLIPLYRTDGSRHGVVYRPDVPAERNGRKAKYVSARGSGRQLDVPPRCQPHMGDPSVPLFVVEGHQKADAIAARGGCAVAIDGVYGWRGKNDVGGITALPDWEDIALKGRTIYLGFDSDARSNEQVAQALRRLDRWLSSKGAVVKAVIPPAAEDGRKTGADDFLKEHGLEEYVALAENVKQAEPNSNERGPSQADLLVELGRTAELFHDPSGTGFARLHLGSHLEIWPLQSKRFKNWLRLRHYQQFGKAPNSDAVNAACGVLDGIACFDGTERNLHNRVAWLDGAIYYDLADQRWRAIRVHEDGWEIVERPPIVFRRYAHQRPQVEPIAGGDTRAVLRFLNIHPDDQLLLLVWLVAAFVPDIPHPVPDFHGEKGSGKSVGQRVLRRVIDPSCVESLAFPSDVRELVQQLSHHYAPVYDNVDHLPPWVTDILCRAVTGEGFSKRELYSDDEDIIYSYRRVIMLNGINVVAERADLLDRSILIALNRISRTERREEREFWQRFDEAHPYILGGVLDTLSAAMRVYPTLQVPSLERMADFTRWGAAIAEALGYGAGEFLRAYGSNIGVQTLEAVQGHIVGAAILSLMEGHDEWSGTPTELLAALEDAGEDARLFRRRSNGKVDAKGWPGAPHILSRRLNEIRSNLTELGIEIVGGRGDERVMTIRKVAAEGGQRSVSGVGSVDLNLPERTGPDATDAADARSADSRVDAWEKVIE